MRKPFLKRILKPALITLILVVVLGSVFWRQLPALIEREFGERLAAAGFPGSSLRVESVGLRQLEVLDLSVSNVAWEVRLRQGLARYHPFEVFRPEIRSLQLAGLRIDLNLEPVEPSPAVRAFDRSAWPRLMGEAPARLPVRRVSVVDGFIRVHRGRREVTLPFEMNLTNDLATRQLRVTAQGTNAQGRIHLEGQIERGIGLRVGAQLDLADDWSSWLPLVLPAELPGALQGLHLEPAQLVLELQAPPGVGDLELKGATAKLEARTRDGAALLGPTQYHVRLREDGGVDQIVNMMFEELRHAGLLLSHGTASISVTQSLDRLEWRALVDLSMEAVTVAGRAFHATAVEADASFALAPVRTPGSDSVSQGRFRGQAASILFAGIEVASAQVSGEFSPERAGIAGVATLDAEPFAFDLHLVPADGEPAAPGLAGEFSIGTLRFREFQPPPELTGGESVRINGELDARGRFHMVPGASLDLEPDLDLALESVEWSEQGLRAEGIRGTVSGIVPGTPEAEHPNLVYVDRVRFGDYEATELTLRAARLNHRRFRFELVDARFLEGRVRTHPFEWDIGSGSFEVMVELEQVSLPKLARLIPKFAGSVEGVLGGRLPLHFESSRVSLGQATLQLDHSRPARIRYPAKGLLTQGIPAGSARRQQLELIEEALQDLRLTNLVVDFHSPDSTQSPIRLRLEGTFSSAGAIIPVKFNLNVNGDLDTVWRLLSTGEIELSL